MTRHQDVVDNPLVRERCGALAAVTAVVGDAQVRHRGTIGGALAHGDPASDLPGLLLALEGSVVAQGPSGQREIPASEFFVDFLTTALAEDEVVTEIRVPTLDGAWSWRYEKFSRVAQAWAIVGALALVRRSNGTIEDARVTLTNMGTVPLRASGVEEALRGGTADAIGDAAAQAAEGTAPASDLNATADFRRHLARVLTRRALEAAAG
jgi:aerobic carbon-monoxide dehydrogenase medium subunit